MRQQYGTKIIKLILMNNNEDKSIGGPKDILITSSKKKFE